LAAAGLLVWIVSVWFVSWAGKVSRQDSDLSYDPERTARGAISGEAEIEGRSDELVTRSASLLASGKLGLPFGPARILERTADRIGFTASGIGTQLRSSFRGSLSFTAANPRRTVVRYEATVGRGGLLIAARVVLVAGLLVLIGLYLTLDDFVIGSPNPAVRAQAVQMAQAVHFLWPPFLLAGLERARRRVIRNTLETFVSNLPHVG
ncbi:MAG: hypothetical protein V2A76_15355, partial [Planctomycetota bacterium]